MRHLALVFGLGLICGACGPGERANPAVDAKSIPTSAVAFECDWAANRSQPRQWWSYFRGASENDGMQNFGEPWIDAPRDKFPHLRNLSVEIPICSEQTDSDWNSELGAQLTRTQLILPSGTVVRIFQNTSIGQDLCEGKAIVLLRHRGQHGNPTGPTEFNADAEDPLTTVPMTSEKDVGSGFRPGLPEYNALARGWVVAMVHTHVDGAPLAMTPQEIPLAAQAVKQWLARESVATDALLFMYGGSYGGITTTSVMQLFPRLFAGGLAWESPLSSAAMFPWSHVIQRIFSELHGIGHRPFDVANEMSIQMVVNDAAARGLDLQEVGLFTPDEKDLSKTVANSFHRLNRPLYIVKGDEDMPFSDRNIDYQRLAQEAGAEVPVRSFRVPLAGHGNHARYDRWNIARRAQTGAGVFESLVDETRELYGCSQPTGGEPGKHPSRVPTRPSQMTAFAGFDRLLKMGGGNRGSQPNLLSERWRERVYPAAGRGGNVVLSQEQGALSLAFASMGRAVKVTLGNTAAQQAHQVAFDPQIWDVAEPGHLFRVGETLVSVGVHGKVRTLRASDGALINTVSFDKQWGRGYRNAAQVGNSPFIVTTSDAGFFVVYQAISGAAYGVQLPGIAMGAIAPFVKASGALRFAVAGPANVMLLDVTGQVTNASNHLGSIPQSVIALPSAIGGARLIGVNRGNVFVFSDQAQELARFTDVSISRKAMIRSVSADNAEICGYESRKISCMRLRHTGTGFALEPGLTFSLPAQASALKVAPAGSGLTVEPSSCAGACEAVVMVATLDNGQVALLGQSGGVRLVGRPLGSAFGLHRHPQTGALLTATQSPLVYGIDPVNGVSQLSLHNLGAAADGAGYLGTYQLPSGDTIDAVGGFPNGGVVDHQRGLVFSVVSGRLLALPIEDAACSVGFGVCSFAWHSQQFATYSYFEGNAVHLTADGRVLVGSRGGKLHVYQGGLDDHPIDSPSVLQLFAEDGAAPAAKSQDYGDGGVAVGSIDRDGDGFAELLMLGTMHGDDGADGAVHLLSQQGDQLVELGRVNVGLPVFGVMAADLTGDGNLELVIGSVNDLRVYSVDWNTLGTAELATSLIYRNSDIGRLVGTHGAMIWDAASQTLIASSTDGLFSLGRN